MTYLLTALTVVFTGALFTWLCWGMYVLVMGLYRAKLDGTLTKVGYAMGMPYLIIGQVMDVILNAVVGTVVFRELPRELMLTSRLKRHLRAGAGWRYKRAKAICESLLDYLDPKGSHCL